MADLNTKANRRSPFTPYRDELAQLPEGMRVREIPFLAMASIRTKAPVEGLPLQPNTFQSDDGSVVVWIGPDEWLAIADGEPAELVSDWVGRVAEAGGAVVDVSGQRTVLELQGDRARDLLTHGCAHDLRAQQAPTGTSLTTMLAQANVSILVRDDGQASGTQTFWLLVRASFARYVAQWLVDASTEYRGG